MKRRLGEATSRSARKLAAAEDEAAKAYLSGLVLNEEKDSERAALEAVEPLFVNRKAAAYYEAEAKRLDPIVRQWLNDHDGERLFDSERGFVAYLESGGESVHYEKAAIIKARDKALYKRLDELGCLTIDPAAVKEAIGKGWLHKSDLEPWTQTGQRTPRLQVKEEKRR
jgi:hypothetical protein